MSLKEVAKRAGVSVSTVSRVINHKYLVKEDTRKKVNEVIKELEYKPDLLARGLRIQKTNLIGLLVPDIDTPFFSRLSKYIEEAALKKGYAVILCSTGNNPAKEEMFVRLFLQRKVDGIIWSRVSDESFLLKSLGKNMVPCVIFDRKLGLENIPTVALDNRMGGQMAAEHLVELGHEKIACITGPLKINICRERLEGFLDVLKRMNVRLPNNYIFEGNFKVESGINALKYFLKLPDVKRPTAIFSMNDLMAIGIMQEARKYGLFIPEDLSIIGFDNVFESSICYCPLTTISQPFEKIAEEGIKLMVKLIQKKKIRKNTVLIKPNIIVRSSTRPLVKKTFEI